MTKKGVKMIQNNATKQDNCVEDKVLKKECSLITDRFQTLGGFRKKGIVCLIGEEFKRSLTSVCLVIGHCVRNKEFKLTKILVSLLRNVGPESQKHCRTKEEE